MASNSQGVLGSTERYQNHASRFLEVDGVRIHYRDEGSGPTLVLLHGVMASLHTWDGWVEQLSSRYRIIRLDLPGFGLSDDVPVYQYNPHQSARLFDRIRELLGIEHFFLAGNSLGGFLGWYYAAHYPERVDKLVLLNPIAYPQKLPPVMKFVSLPGIGEIARVITPRAIIAQNVRMVYGDPKNVTEETIERYYQLLMRGNNRRAMVRTFRTIKGYSTNPNIARDISKVSCPTLLIWGDRDRWVPIELIANWRRDLRNLKVKVYPGLGHIPMEEKPELTAQDVHAFLSES
jgi:pimeloyl-ACP methyl ester carboxylesterase